MLLLGKHYLLKARWVQSLLRLDRLGFLMAYVRFLSSAFRRAAACCDGPRHQFRCHIQIAFRDVWSDGAGWLHLCLNFLKKKVLSTCSGLGQPNSYQRIYPTESGYHGAPYPARLWQPFSALAHHWPSRQDAAQPMASSPREPLGKRKGKSHCIAAVNAGIPGSTAETKMPALAGI